MSEKYKARNPVGLYFITLTVIDWVDLFTRPGYKHFIIESLEYCQTNKGLVVYEYVIMTSHVHMIISAKEGFNISDIIRDFKQYTNIKLIEAIKDFSESRRVWLLKKFEFALTESNEIPTIKYGWMAIILLNCWTIK